MKRVFACLLVAVQGLRPIRRVQQFSTPAAIPISSPVTPSSESPNPSEAPLDTASQAYLRIGSVCAVPVGFKDLAGVWRDKAAGTSVGTNFGNIPYNNSTAGRNSEFRFTP